MAGKKTINKPTQKVLLIATFLIKLALVIVIPYFAIFVLTQVQNSSLGTIGFCSALIVIAYMLSHFVVTSIVKRFKDVRLDVSVALLGTFIMALAFLLISFIYTGAQLYALSIVLGGAMAFMYSGWKAIVINDLKVNVVYKEWKVFDVLSWLVIAVMVVLAAIIVSNYSFFGLFLIASLLLILSSLMLAAVRSNLG